MTVARARAAISSGLQNVWLAGKNLVVGRFRLGMLSGQSSGIAGGPPMADSGNPGQSSFNPETRRVGITRHGGEASLPGEDPAQTRPREAGAGFNESVLQGGRIGSFEVLRLLGAGSNGSVFLAREDGTGREVALKVLRAGREDGTGEAEGLEAEAKVQANLKAGGFVRLLSVGKSPRGPWLAMEYCAGGTLAGWVARRALAPRQAAGIVLELARSMGQAHAEGMVHRDLKPGNILLRRERLPGDCPGHDDLRIGDLGLARIMGDGPLELSAELVGTPLYMAPEQAERGGQVGPAADVHALGVILYELITGRVPFQGAAVAEVVAQLIRDEPVSPRLLVPSCPRDLEQVCLKCLSKESSGRYRDGLALAADLEAFLEGRPVSARPPGALENAIKWVRRKPAAATAWAMGLLLAISLVAGSLTVARMTVLADRRQEEERVGGLLRALLSASADGAADILAALRGGGETARRMARDWLADPGIDVRGRGALALFLYPENATAEILLGIAKSGEPGLLSIMAGAFASHPPEQEVVKSFWGAIRDSEGTGPVLGVASMLATLDPTNAAWESLDSRVANELLAETPARARVFASLLAPRAGPLLDVVGGMAAKPDVSPVEQAAAYQVIAALVGDDPERVVDRIMRSRAPLPGPLIPALKTDRERALAAIGRWRATPLEPAREAALHAMAIALGDAESLRALAYRPDPTVRTELIRLLHTAVPDPAELAAWLSHGDPGVVSGIALALGDYDAGTLTRRLGKSLGRFLEAFRSHPDPGVHGALEWLLRRRFGRGREVDEALVGHAAPGAAGGRGWRAGPGTASWLEVRGPVKLDGSALVLPAKTDVIIANGAMPRAAEVVIPRSFAIATKLVTRREYRLFRSELPPGNDDLHPDAPVRGVSLSDAFAYCRWLSAREGIAEDQMAVPDGSLGLLAMPKGFLSRPGYRLPTDWECEYAWRAGTTSRWHWGTDGLMLDRYGAYPGGISVAPEAVALARPNAFGMFDMAGANTWQWSLTCGGTRLVDPRKTIVDDEPWQFSGQAAGYTPTDRLLMRGTSLLSMPELSASSYRGLLSPMGQNEVMRAVFGIRLARTLPEGGALKAP
ncbi:MAG: protein kinase [Planctomycetes bacterium]|nr:protein kinase [Planctomycetota bacterium]